MTHHIIHLVSYDTVYQLCLNKNIFWNFNITVIQVYAPTSNAEEAEVEWVYEDLQDLLELTHKKDVLFIIGAGTQKYGIKKYLE